MPITSQPAAASPSAAALPIPLDAPVMTIDRVINVFLGLLCRLGLHRFHQVGRGCSFERESIANFPHETLFQRLNEVYTGVAACHLRCLQVLLGQFARPTQCLAVWHYLSDNSPLVRGSSRNRLWVQQKCLSSSCSGAIAPGREDSVARHDTAGEMRHIMEGRTVGRHDDTGKQRIFRVHMSASFNSRDHRHAYIRDVLDNLNPFIMSLAPDTRISD